MMQKINFILALTLLSFMVKAQDVANNSHIDMKYTILVLYKIQPSFLQLDRSERNKVMEKQVAPIMANFADKLEIRMFDSEAFHATTSDFLIIECADLSDYYFFMERLRDTPLFTKPYIQLNDIIIGLEDGFRQFENKQNQ